MGEVRFMISEAAKQVRVESHVLRYWEEELDLKIGRTEMGHRYYTEDDIQLFRCIKKLKNEGMLLRDLKPLIPELKATRKKLAAAKPTQAPGQENSKTEPKQNKSAVTAGQKNTAAVSSKAISEPQTATQTTVSEHTLTAPLKADKPESETSKTNIRPTEQAGTASQSAGLSVAQAEVIPITQLEQVRSLIGDVLTEVVTTNNETLEKNISRKVTTDVMREMDFLFQAKERQEEEHFRKLDCLIRQQQASRREASKESPIGKLKKILT